MNQYSESGDAREARIVGVTVLGDFIVSEGGEPILDNLQRAGVTAVACNPTVTVPAAEGEGSFQPPTDAGSSPRVFDRLLFNKQSLWLQSGPSYYPDETCYRDSVYRPRKPNAITDKYGECIEHFIKSAQKRGLKVYFQLGLSNPQVCVMKIVHVFPMEGFLKIEWPIRQAWPVWQFEITRVVIFRICSGSILIWMVFESIGLNTRAIHLMKYFRTFHVMLRDGSRIILRVDSILKT